MLAAPVSKRSISALDQTYSKTRYQVGAALLWSSSPDTHVVEIGGILYMCVQLYIQQQCISSYMIFWTLFSNQYKYVQFIMTACRSGNCT